MNGLNLEGERRNLNASLNYSSTMNLILENLALLKYFRRVFYPLILRNDDDIYSISVERRLYKLLIFI